MISNIYWEYPIVEICVASAIQIVQTIGALIGFLLSTFAMSIPLHLRDGVYSIMRMTSARRSRLTFLRRAALLKNSLLSRKLLPTVCMLSVLTKEISAIILMPCRGFAEALSRFATARESPGKSGGYEKPFLNSSLTR